MLLRTPIYSLDRHFSLLLVALRRSSSNTDLFQMPTLTVGVSHGGSLMRGRVKRYDGKAIRKFELKDIDTDVMSWIDFNQYLKENDVKDVELWYKYPDVNDFFKFASDIDWMNLVENLQGRDYVDVFVEHDVYRAEGYVEGSQQHNVEVNKHPESDDNDSDFISDEFIEEGEDSEEDLSEFVIRFSEEMNRNLAIQNFGGSVHDSSEDEDLYSPPKSDEEDNRREQPFRMHSYETNSSSNTSFTMNLGDGFDSPDHLSPSGMQVYSGTSELAHKMNKE